MKPYQLSYQSQQSLINVILLDTQLFNIKEDQLSSYGDIYHLIRLMAQNVLKETCIVILQHHIFDVIYWMVKA